MRRGSRSPRKISASASTSPMAKHGRNGRTSTSSAAAATSRPRRAIHHLAVSTLSGSRSARAYADSRRSRSKKARTSAAGARSSMRISGTSGAAVIHPPPADGDTAGLRRPGCLELYQRRDLVALEALAPLQELQLDEERERHDLALQLLHELDRPRDRAARREEVVDDEH